LIVLMVGLVCVVGAVVVTNVFVVVVGVGVVQ
jgi:hypothetical protein